MSAPEYHVLIRPGDARPEVDRALEALKRERGADADLGFHKYMYVTRAEQTVVMVSGPDAPVAVALRTGKGWTEPGSRGG